jgi:hypothetical protein
MRGQTECTQDCGNRADSGRGFGVGVRRSFSFTKEAHEAKIGPIELSVKDKQTVNVAVWAGVGAQRAAI